MRFAIVAHRHTETNVALAWAGSRHLPSGVSTPRRALLELEPGDVALARLDVRPSLEGVEDGIAVLGSLAAYGVRVLNPAGALLACHDKLLTARLLRRAGVPHPR